MVFGAFLLHFRLDLRQSPYYETLGHAGVVVWLSGEQLDLSRDQFQSTDEVFRHRFLHLHDGVGTVLHVHSQDHALGDFFASIGMTLTDTCFTTYAGEEHCADEEQFLALYVQNHTEEYWTQVSAVERFVPRDLQRLVLYFGVKRDDEDLIRALSAVADDGCPYSDTCFDQDPPSLMKHDLCSVDSLELCEGYTVIPLRRSGA